MAFKCILHLCHTFTMSSEWLKTTRVLLCAGGMDVRSRVDLFSAPWSVPRHGRVQAAVNWWGPGLLGWGNRIHPLSKNHITAAWKSTRYPCAEMALGGDGVGQPLFNMVTFNNIDNSEKIREKYYTTSIYLPVILWVKDLGPRCDKRNLLPLVLWHCRS